MATNYPTGLDSYTTKVDNVDDVLAAHVNNAQDALVALQVKLGIDSSSNSATIDYFLKHASGNFRTHVHDGSSDDGANIPGSSLTSLSSTTAGAGSFPFSAIEDVVDTDGTLSGNSDEEVASQKATKTYVDNSPNIIVTSEPASDHVASGVKTTLTATSNLAFGDVCYIASNGRASLIDADAIGSSSGICMCCDESINAGSSGNFLLLGIARDDTWNWTVGGLIYGSTTGTTGNTLTQTKPSGTDDVVQILGVATHADRMYFNPQIVQVEHV